MLLSNGYDAFRFTNGSAALEAAVNEPPDLFLLDISMPDMDGFQVCERLKQNPDLKDIPVIFLSSLNATEDKLLGF